MGAAAGPGGELAQRVVKYTMHAPGLNGKRPTVESTTAGRIPGLDEQPVMMCVHPLATRLGVGDLFSRQAVGSDLRASDGVW